MSLQIFEGDLLLRDTLDGGDITITDGFIVSDRTFDTAIYLSLFGGNKEDSGRVQNKKTWWGNTLRGVNENQKLVSRFQAFIFGTPMSTKNILEAEEVAKLDLAWLVDEKLANEIIVDGRAVGHNRLSLKIQLKAGEEIIYTHTFLTPWGAGKHGTI
ncbi:MAG: hypothetical protein FWC97_00390 [Treponema sp.]|nr:hypothetical protein [Treponema sp.]